MSPVTANAGMLAARSELASTRLRLSLLVLNFIGCSNLFNQLGVPILADENMKKLLGVDKDADPAKCYQAWVNNIAEEYLDYVKDARDTMMVTDKTAQIEYKGFSPQHGKVTIRCVGTKTSENEAVVTIDGYYRILEDMLQIRK